MLHFVNTFETFEHILGLIWDDTSNDTLRLHHVSCNYASFLHILQSFLDMQTGDTSCGLMQA